MARLGWLLPVLGVIFWTRTASACASCAAGDPAITASGSERPFESRKRISLDLRATHARAADVDVSEERLELRADFAVTPSILMTAALPLLARSIRNRDGASSREIRLGDAELRASSIVADTGFSSVRRMLLVFGGSKFPTAPLQTDARGAPLPVALQPGCGSLVPILGASFVLTSSPLTFVASTSIYLPFSAREGPHAGDSWRTSLTLQYQPARSTIGTRFGISSRVDQPGTIADGESVDPNSGGLVGYASGEVLMTPVTDVVLSTGFFAPAIQVLRGSERESTIALVTASYDF